MRVSDRPDRHARHLSRPLIPKISKVNVKSSSLQTTISKLATRISDVEFNGINTTLSNALAPLFDGKSPVLAKRFDPAPPPRTTTTPKTLKEPQSFLEESQDVGHVEEELVYGVYIGGNELLMVMRAVFFLLLEFWNFWVR